MLAAIELSANGIAALIVGVVGAIGGPPVLVKSIVWYRDWLAKKDDEREKAYQTALAAKDAEIAALRAAVEAGHEENKKLSRELADDAKASTREVVNAINANSDAVKELAARIEGRAA